MQKLRTCRRARSADKDSFTAPAPFTMAEAAGHCAAVRGAQVELDDAFKLAGHFGAVHGGGVCVAGAQPCAATSQLQMSVGERTLLTWMNKE